MITKEEAQPRRRVIEERLRQHSKVIMIVGVVVGAGSVAARTWAGSWSVWLLLMLYALMCISVSFGILYALWAIQEDKQGGL